MSLQALFQSYGWQLAIVGLLGTFLVGALKKPVRAIVTKKSAAEKVDTTFDTVAFVLGFLVAVLFGCLYTLVATKLNWISEDKLEVPIATVYLSNSVGAWLYQITYYQVWKKFGLKRFLQFVWAHFKSQLDKNGDGVIDFDEAVSIVSGFIKNGELNINEILASISAVAPSALDSLIEAVSNETGEIDVSANLDRLDQIADEIVDSIPSDKLKAVVDALLKKAEEKVKEAAQGTVDVPETQSLPQEEISVSYNAPASENIKIPVTREASVTEENAVVVDNDEKPKRPVVRF